MHNKHLMNAGYYLLLIFSFTVALFPSISYMAALLISVVWLVDLAIFKEPKFQNMPLFFPLMALSIFIAAAGVVSGFQGGHYRHLNLALLPLYYFVVPGFIITVEQRRMILWTFCGGILLHAGLRIIGWWGGLRNADMLAQPFLSFYIFVICIMIALFAESRGIRERIFYLLTILPLLASSFLSYSVLLILVLFVTAVVLALVRQRWLLAPIAIAIGLALYASNDAGPGAGGGTLLAQVKSTIILPFTAAKSDDSIITGARFFGAGNRLPVSGIYSGNSYFLDIIRSFGPPSFLLILYILVERGRESFFKRKKVTLAEEKTYHLAVLLVIAAIFATNLYDNAFNFSNVVLVAWMILGLSEV